MEVQELSMYAHEGAPIQEEEFSGITYVVSLETAITLIVDYHDIVDEAYEQREAENSLQTMKPNENYIARHPEEPMIVQAEQDEQEEDPDFSVVPQLVGDLQGNVDDSGDQLVPTVCYFNARTNKIDKKKKTLFDS